MLPCLPRASSLIEVVASHLRTHQEYVQKYLRNSREYLHHIGHICVCAPWKNKQKKLRSRLSELRRKGFRRFPEFAPFWKHERRTRGLPIIPSTRGFIIFPTNLECTRSAPPTFRALFAEPRVTDAHWTRIFKESTASDRHTPCRLKSA